MEVREVDRETTWVLRGQVYEKTTVLTERIPVDEVLKCKYCDEPLFDCRLDRIFCSDAHKTAWWRAHRNEKTSA